ERQALHGAIVSRTRRGVEGGLRVQQRAPGGVPAPDVFRRDVRAADPAVDAEQAYAVGLAGEHALALLREPEPGLSEPLAVAERRGRRNLIALLRLDETVGSAAEPRERAVEPGVSEERCVFAILGGDERGARRAGARGDDAQRVPFRRREPVAGSGELLEQAP